MSKINAITIKENEKYLRQRSLEVDIYNDQELKKDISILDEFCKENKVMAMAAIQLGIPKRIIYLKNTNLDIIMKNYDGELYKDGGSISYKFKVMDYYLRVDRCNKIGGSNDIYIGYGDMKFMCN